MEDSDGHAISVLEHLLGIKRPARTFWEKYCYYCWSCCKTDK